MDSLSKSIKGLVARLYFYIIAQMQGEVLGATRAQQGKKPKSRGPEHGRQPPFLTGLLMDCFFTCQCSSGKGKCCLYVRRQTLFMSKKHSNRELLCDFLFEIGCFQSLNLSFLLFKNKAQRIKTNFLPLEGITLQKIVVICYSYIIYN